MDLLPHEHIKLITKLKKEEIIERLAWVTEATSLKSSGHWISRTKFFEGQIGLADFRIRHLRALFNYFRPEIAGVINSESTGATIMINMKSDIRTCVFTLALFTVTGFVFAQMLNSAHMPELVDINLFVLVPFIAFSYACGMIYLGFNAWAYNAKEKLAEIFEAEIIDQNASPV